jgi:hypothetical protein
LVKRSELDVEKEKRVSHTEKVYLFVHELFGVSIGNEDITLVTPRVGGEHSYKLAQFADGTWSGLKDMEDGATYQLKGVIAGRTTSFPDPCSPCPDGEFSIRANAAFCTWKLEFPRQVHRLRLVDINSVRPLFGRKHGEYVDSYLRAVSIVQVFEYLPDGTDVRVVRTLAGKESSTTFEPDELTHTINLHVWAELEHAHFANPGQAIKHAIEAFKSLADLFSGLEMTGLNAVPTDRLFADQPPMPEGVRFVELMTLSEIHNVRGPISESAVGKRWTPKTCGVAGNLYVRSSA